MTPNTKPKIDIEKEVNETATNLIKKENNDINSVQIKKWLYDNPDVITEKNISENVLASNSKVKEAMTAVNNLNEKGNPNEPQKKDMLLKNIDSNMGNARKTTAENLIDKVAHKLGKDKFSGIDLLLDPDVQNSLAESQQTYNTLSSNKYYEPGNPIDLANELIKMTEPKSTAEMKLEAKRIIDKHPSKILKDPRDSS